MLHTKFQGFQSIGSGEEDFLRFLPYVGMAAILVMWSRPFEYFFFPKGPGGCIWNLVTIGPVVSEDKSFEIVDGRTTDDGACLYYKLPWSLRLRWAKNFSLKLLQFANIAAASTNTDASGSAIPLSVYAYKCDTFSSTFIHENLKWRHLK